MEDLYKITQIEAHELLHSLDDYQREIIEVFLIDTSNDYLASADKWLSATTANTAKFGGDIKPSKIFREKLLLEVEKFLCGDQAYEDDRRKISESANKTKEYIISVMSSAIALAIGTAGTFIAPVIVLLILSISKMGLNAWCEMRKETRKEVK